MKILLFDGEKLTRHSSSGTYLRTLIKGLSESSKGIDISITVPNSTYKRIIEQFIKCESLALDVCTFSELRKCIKEADIIHIPSGFAGVINYPLSLALLKPLVVTIHGISPLYAPSHGTYYEAIKWKIKFSFTKDRIRMLGSLLKDRLIIVTPSKRAKEQVSKFLINELMLRVATIYHGVDTERFKSLSKILEESSTFSEKILNTLGIEPYTYFLHVGCHHPAKGASNVLLAFKKLCKHMEGSKIKLIMIGYEKASYTKKVVKSVVSKLKLNDYVVFKGTISNLVLMVLYKFSLGLLAPSYNESFGYPVVEALITGAPVLTTHYVASAEEVLKDCVVFVKNPSNIDEFAEKMLYLIEEQENLRRLARKSIEVIERKLSSKSMGEQYIRVYSQLLSKESNV